MAEVGFKRGVTAEKAILVAVKLPKEREEEQQESMVELRHLARTAGARVLAEVVQEREKLDPATYIGRGKAQQVGGMAEEMEADLVIFDENLTPSQQKNLEEITGVKVVDRTQLILDIFAQRARSGEGKLQVELAQMDYLSTRLIGKGLSMSRLGGGIGTRGPGETQLETDRRRIRRRVQTLRERLVRVRRSRDTQRKTRQKRGLLQVALVGYTNAGKSTLMNRLTGTHVLVEDKLFATLDPTLRRLKLPGGTVAILSDTVGFIQRIPHQLIEAFKATLEEVNEADLLMHVVDASHPMVDHQIAAVNHTLNEIGAGDKPLVTALNKADLVENPISLKRLSRVYEGSVSISALKGDGLDELLSRVEEALTKVER